jgi:hypothetical protein
VDNGDTKTSRRTATVPIPSFASRPPRAELYATGKALRDVKIKFAVENFGSVEMLQFAKFCGWALAHSHARSGEPVVITGYLGKSDRFDTAIAAFSVAYADQTERDHAAMKSAAKKGRLEVLMERE